MDGADRSCEKKTHRSCSRSRPLCQFAIPSRKTYNFFHGSHFSSSPKLPKLEWGHEQESGNASLRKPQARYLENNYAAISKYLWRYMPGIYVQRRTTIGPPRARKATNTSTEESNIVNINTSRIVGSSFEPFPLEDSQETSTSPFGETPLQTFLNFFIAEVARNL